MPLYEYVCDSCSEEFESIQPIKERDKADCPNCGRRSRRLLSGFAIGGGGSLGGSSIGSSASSGASCNFTSG